MRMGGRRAQHWPSYEAQFKRRRQCWPHDCLQMNHNSGVGTVSWIIKHDNALGIVVLLTTGLLPGLLLKPNSELPHAVGVLSQARGPWPGLSSHKLCRQFGLRVPSRTFQDQGLNHKPSRSQAG